MKAFSGLTVKLDYPVPSIRKPEEVEVLFYKDEECKVPFDWFNVDSPFLNADIYQGVGNGDGGQMVRSKKFVFFDSCDVASNPEIHYR